MSYLPLDQMAFRDGANLDAFGRLRVSNATQLFGLAQEYSPHPLVWDNTQVGTGTVTHSTLTGSSTLTTGGNGAGARAMRQTKIYYRYAPGKSQLVKQTGTLRKSGTASGAAFTALGYYDDDNGCFFRYQASGVSVVVRSNTSGSPVDDSILQSGWNLDTLDGNGPSGIAVDWTKEQIFIIDLQWLGVGRVRFGLDIAGVLVYCHEFLHANETTAPYMRTANLPLRSEAFNSGGAGSNVSAQIICSSLESEGGPQEGDFYPFAYPAYLSPYTIDSTLRPIVTRRMRDTFNGLKARGHAHLSDFQMLVGTNDVYWEIRYNASVVIGGGGSATTNLVDATYSQSEYDTYTGSANTVSGGVVMLSGFARAGSGSTKEVATLKNDSAESLLLLGRTYANVRDSYTLCARSISGNANVSVAVDLMEQY